MKNTIVSILVILCSFQEPSLKWDYDKTHWSLLMMAIYDSDLDKVSMLIRKKEQITFAVYDENHIKKLTALDVAIMTKNELAVKLLLDTKKFDHLNDYLIKASAQDNVPILNLIIENGGDVNYILKNGYTPIIMATVSGSAEVLTEIVKKSKTVNKQRSTVTALMIAAKNLDIEKVNILLKYNADKTLIDAKGRTAFDYLRLGTRIKTSKKEKIDTVLIDKLENLLKVR